MGRPRTGTTFKEETHAGRILKAVALAGEFPYRSIYLLGGSNRILKRVVFTMKEEGYITIPNKGALKTIRFTLKALDKLEEAGLLEHYMFMSNGHKFTGTGYASGERMIWRNHRMAEAICMFSNLGATIDISKKPQISLMPNDEGAGIGEDDFYFYTSKEIKSADVEQRYKYDFTRILGILFSPGGIYSVYNTNEGRMKWTDQGEIKSKVLMEDIVKRNCSFKGVPINHCIIFVKDISVANSILTKKGGIKDENGMEFLSFNNIYNNIHIITLDGNGLYQLLMMTQKDWMKVFRLSLFDKELLIREKINIDADAFDKNSHKYILLFLDGDISRLKRFHDAASIPNQKSQYEVVGFDWQEEFLKGYIGNVANVVSITQDDLSNYINNAFG